MLISPILVHAPPCSVSLMQTSVGGKLFPVAIQKIPIEEIERAGGLSGLPSHIVFAALAIIGHARNVKAVMRGLAEEGRTMIDER